MTPERATRVLFVETSAMVDLTLQKGKAREFEAALRPSTGPPPVRVTNQYVRMELKRGVIQYLVYLHNVACDARRVADVHKAVSGLSAGMQKHRLGTVLEALESFWRRIGREATGNEPMDDYVLRKLRDHLATLIITLWESIRIWADGLQNPMDCFKDIAPPRLDRSQRFDNKPRTCDKSNQRCTIQRYFSANHAEFSAALAGLESEAAPDAQQSTAKTQLKENLRKCNLGSYQIGNHDTHSAKRCWNCGDVILAVSSPDGSTILTSNTRHFHPLSKTLRRAIVPEPEQ